jgi:U-box domain
MTSNISSIRSIGPLLTDMFARLGYFTIEDLKRFDADDRRFIPILETMKAERPLLSPAFWKRACTRCTNIIRKVQNATEAPGHPYHLMCPISLDLMRDPVIVMSGISYERESLIDWLQYSPTDPLTRTALTLDQVITNLALRESVECYRRNHLIYFL